MTNTLSLITYRGIRGIMNITLRFAMTGIVLFPTLVLGEERNPLLKHEVDANKSIAKLTDVIGRTLEMRVPTFTVRALITTAPMPAGVELIMTQQLLTLIKRSGWIRKIPMHTTCATSFT